MKYGQMGANVIKIVLISVGVVAFLSVVVTTYNVFQTNSPDVLNNCITKPVLVSNDGAPIASKDDAAAFLRDRVGGEVVFLQNTVDVCNPPYMGYLYNATDGKYVVCEDGALYKYSDVCTEGGKAESLVSMLKTNE